MAGGEDVTEEDEDDDLEPPLHRLCPTYAQDINSPLRHVRTRIYFTSESHVHSLINVLRYCHIGDAPPESSLPTSLAPKFTCSPLLLSAGLANCRTAALTILPVACGDRKRALEARSRGLLFLVLPLNFSGLPDCRV